jgi:hypothetical protein
MGLDKIEYGISLVGGAIAMFLALYLSPRLFKNTRITSTAKPLKDKACAAGYHLVNNSSLCEKYITTHPSYWLPQFLEILVLALGIILFAWRRKRVGVTVCSLLIGLALGTLALPYLILGAWLIIRAFRLQRYGDATFAGSSKRARELGKAKREGRATAAPDKKPVASLPPLPPAESKRYTPKKPPRRKK